MNKETNEEPKIELVNLKKQYSGNKKEKNKLIKDCLNDIKYKKTKHYNKFRKLKKINGILKSGINALNAASVCSLVISMSPVSIISLIVALTTTSISTVTSAIVTAYELENKLHSHQVSYLQYTDIYRDISSKLFRNHLSSEDYDIMLSEINNRLSIIEDTELPI